MRNYVEETNILLDGMNSGQFGIRVRQLLIQYRNACDARYYELNSFVPFSRTHLLRVELMQIGAVLNSWIERVLADNLRLQGLVNRAEFDMKINRLADALPRSVPASLVK